jgi:prepilin-type N-terminal cleavage/methylation domain-containing protein
MKQKKNKLPFMYLNGFTLIELLIVIGIIAVLAAFAFVALNPLQRFADSRNARRWADVNAIMSAIKLQQVDNGGNYITAIANLTPDLYFQIGRGNECDDECAGTVLQSDCIDLEGLVNTAYLPSIPIDPNFEGASVDETRYYMVKDSYGRIVVGSCGEETGSDGRIPVIEISR